MDGAVVHSYCDEINGSSAVTSRHLVIGVFMTALTMLSSVVAGEASPAVLSVFEAVDHVEQSGGSITFGMIREDVRFRISNASQAVLDAVHDSDQSARSMTVQFAPSSGTLDAESHKPTFVVVAIDYKDQHISVVSVKDGNQQPTQGSSRSAAEQALVRGVALAAAGRSSDAIDAVNEAMATSPTALGADARLLAIKTRGQMFARRADEVSAEGTSAESDRYLISALKDLQAWERLDPTDVEARYASARALVDLGAYDDALAIYTAIPKHWPNETYWPTIRTGTIYRQRRDYAGALQALDSLVVREGLQTGMAFHFHRGWTLNLLGRYAEAESELSEGLKHQPDYAWAMAYRACARAGQGHIAPALSDQEAAVAQFRRYPDSGGVDQADRKQAIAVESALRGQLQTGSSGGMQDLCKGYLGYLLPPRARAAGIPSIEPIAAVGSGSTGKSLVPVVLQWTVWAMAMTLIYGGLRRSSARTADVVTDGIRMRQSPWVMGIGNTGLVLFLGAAIVALVAKVPVAIVVLFIGLALLSGWVLLQALMEEHVVGASGIRHRSMFGNKGFVPWTDVQRVQFRAITKRIRLITASGHAVAVTGMMRGSQVFATAVLQHVSPMAIDASTEKVLRALAAGNLEPVSGFHVATPTAVGRAINIVGIGLTVGLGAYAGVSMLIPVVGGILWFRLVPLVVRQRDTTRASALAVQGGLLLWLLVGAYLMRTLQPVALDVGVLAVGIAWWSWRPSVIPAVGLLLFHAYVLVLNIQRLSTARFDEAAHRALVVHAVIHLLVIGLICVWLWKKRGGRGSLRTQ